MDKTKRRMTDIPLDELERMMIEYGKKQASSVRSSRKFLRSLGMKIDRRGYIII